MMKNDNAVTEELMNNPQLLASLQDQANFKLNAMKKYDKLPTTVKRRVKALKNLQIDHIKIEECFFRELSQLEAKYSEKYQGIHDKRKEIISGSREPTDLECDYDDSDDIESLGLGLENKVDIASGDDSCEQIENNKLSLNDNKATDGDIVSIENAIKGIPEFWLTVLQNSELIKENIQDHDIPVLRHLIDIKCIVKVEEETGFVLEFYFSPNEYFTDEKLTKEYFVSVTASAKFPFAYEGPEIVRTKGCTIHWNPGKNKTVKLVKKVQKRGKKDSDKRTITKVVKNDSFFNFFDPPTESLESEDDLSEDIEELLESDFEIGQFIRERIIPRAVLYYTGEAIEDEFDVDEEEEEESDEEESSDFNRDNSHDQNTEPKPECKQQ